MNTVRVFNEPAHEGHERREEHFTIMFRIEITALFGSHVQSSLLQIVPLLLFIISNIEAKFSLS